MNTETLYREAFKWRGTVNKKAAEAEIIALYAQRPEMAPGLGKLLSFFAEKTPKAKTVEGWVGLAASKKDIRKYLQFVHANGFEIAATDGGRLHLAPSNLARGLYDPVSMVKVFDLWEDCSEGAVPGHPGKFPDYPRIIPHAVTVDKADAFLEGPAVKRDGWMVVDVVTPEFVQSFPETQWRQAADRCERVALRGADLAALFEGPGGIKAVVMPCRQPKVPQ